MTLEASGPPPVVTCTDSGGPTELVVDGRSGFVVEPDASSVAAALDELARDPDLAMRLGEEGARSVQAVTWSRVVSAVLATPDRPGADRRSARPGPAAVAAPDETSGSSSSRPIPPTPPTGAASCASIDWPGPGRRSRSRSSHSTTPAASPAWPPSDPTTARRSWRRARSTGSSRPPWLPESGRSR